MVKKKKKTEKCQIYFQKHNLLNKLGMGFWLGNCVNICTRLRMREERRRYSKVIWNAFDLCFDMTIEMKYDATFELNFFIKA